MPAAKRTSKKPPAGETAHDGTGHDERTCPVAFCPVGMFLTFADQSRPEVVEHLVAAGRELMLAVTALMDARAEAVRRAPARVEKIEVD